MDRYEAASNGQLVIGEPFVGFNEIDVLKALLENSNLHPDIGIPGRGGYYPINIVLDGEKRRMHVYLKKLTFGGRENRGYEKRAQFSAALERKGFDNQSASDIRLILAVYKRNLEEDAVICGWSIEDWGQNIGRAFNCFVKIDEVAKAIKWDTGIVQSESSIGQIVCCLKATEENIRFYLKNYKRLHEEVFEEQQLRKLEIVSREDQLPLFDDLFQYVLNALQSLGGKATILEIEDNIAEELVLSDVIRYKLHNPLEGSRTELGYRLAWARNYLKRAGLIRNTGRAIWELTEEGELAFYIDKAEIKRLAAEAIVRREVDDDFITRVEGDVENPEVEAEKVEIEPLLSEDISKINEPFDPNLVDIKTRTMSMDLILKRLDRGEIDLNTSFQRKEGLWDITKQSRLIESILIRFPLPAFYFDGSDDEKWLVVDGLQRLGTLNNFVNSKSFALTNLEFLTQFQGATFNKLPANLQRRIEEFEITAYIISPATPKPLKYIAFKRINTGGLTLTSQEIRNALNQGAPAIFVKKLADLRSFKHATTFSIPDDRMLDREFATRFLAFYSIPLEKYDSDLESFLNTAMEMIEIMPQETLDEIEQRFDKAMLAAAVIFQEHAFRKIYKLNDKRNPINKALFEVWSVSLANLSNSELALLIIRKEVIKESFIQLLNNDRDFNIAISSATSDKGRTRKRFTEINNIIQSTLA